MRHSVLHSTLSVEYSLHR